MALYGGIQLPGRPDLENIRRLDLLPVRPVMEMQKYGMAIDIPHLNALTDVLTKEINELRYEICSHIPPEKLDEFIEKSNMDADDDYLPMNVESTKQMRRLLFEVLGVGKGHALKLTKSGDVSTGKRQMEARKNDHPVVQKVLDYRERAKLRGTYSAKLPKIARFHPHKNCWCGLPHFSPTYRVHCDIMLTRTSTGRPATKNPNLQNVPVRSEHGRSVRKGFIASPGTEMVTVDFSQLELRLLAHFGRVKRFIKVFEEGKDPHTQTAMDAFKVDDPKKIDKNTQRAPAKNVNFAICLKEGQRVLTQRGLVAIQDVLCCDLLWDGIEWVHHDGVVFKGTRTVITYQGVTATPNHKVWLTDGRKMAIGKALAEGFDLAITGSGTTPIEYRPRVTVGKNSQVIRRTSDLGSMSHVQTQEGDFGWEPVKRNKPWLSLSAFLPCRCAFQKVIASIFRYRSTLRQSNMRGMAGLRRPWNTESVSRFGTIRKLYFASITARRLSRLRYWTHQQQWALRTWKFAVGSTLSKLAKYASNAVCGLQRSAVSSYRLVLQTENGLSEIPAYQRAHSTIGLFRCGLERDTKAQAEEACRVYDIMNAGPRRRFTCEGKLVSNCYGESPKGLHEQLVSDTYGKSGIPVPDWLTLAWCEKFMSDWFEIYPEVHEYMEHEHYVARRYGVVWTGMGRIRRVPEVRSVHKRIVASGERQSGNLKIQGTGADMLKLAQAEIQEFVVKEIRSQGIWCWPLNEVHDELIYEIEEGYGEILLAKCEDVMGNVLVDKETNENLCRVPIAAEGKVMKRWEK